jgi:hypothetical protein
MFPHLLFSRAQSPNADRLGLACVACSRTRLSNDSPAIAYPQGAQATAKRQFERTRSPVRWHEQAPAAGLSAPGCGTIWNLNQKSLTIELRSEDITEGRQSLASSKTATGRLAASKGISHASRQTSTDPQQDRSSNANEMRVLKKRLGVSDDDLRRIVAKVGNSIVSKEVELEKENGVNSQPSSPQTKLSSSVEVVP